MHSPLQLLCILYEIWEKNRKYLPFFFHLQCSNGCKFREVFLYSICCPQGSISCMVEKKLSEQSVFAARAEYVPPFEIAYKYNFASVLALNPS